MKRYEQLEFDITQDMKRSTVEEMKCFDNNGNEIKVGDYVIGVRGIPLLNGVEGIVKKIYRYNEYGAYIVVTSYGGKVLDNSGRPFWYEVKEK